MDYSVGLFLCELYVMIRAMILMILHLCGEPTFLMLLKGYPSAAFRRSLWGETMSYRNSLPFLLV